MCVQVTLKQSVYLLTSSYKEVLLFPLSSMTWICECSHFFYIAILSAMLVTIIVHYDELI